MAATKPAFTPPGKKGDMIFSALVKLAALIVLLMLGGIIVSLIISSWPSIQKFGFAFLWTKEWDAPNEIFGALVPIYGTLVTSFIALLIAVPVSFGIALFLTELSPAWLKRPLGIAIELLAAIPSIVYGMWGLFIFAPLFATYFQEPVGNVLSTIPFVGALFAGPAFGIGILAAGVILAIMIIPYIAAVMRDVFEQTPVMMKESAYGIGCTTWEVIWRIVLPFTKNGVIGGVMLGLGRALGETMAVTFIIGNTYQLDSISLYMPGNSITSALANEFAEAETGLHVAALMELGLILFVITFIVRGIMYPLTKAQYTSMAKMRMLQPKIQAMRERLGDDKQRQSQEMMALYKAEKVNPLGGCFPLIIQMPIFLALYYMLSASVELRHAPFILWIHDLSAQDPYYILPIIMGATMFFIQKMSPTTVTDPMQQKIMTFMPVIFTVFFLWFPSGLVLYYIVSNLVTIIQQQLIYRGLEKRGLHSREKKKS